MYKLFIVSFILLGYLTPTVAQTVANPGIRTEVSQQLRIANGVESGALTRPETAALLNQQRVIDNLQTQAMADGHVSSVERRVIRRAQKRANKAIRRNKHDRQFR